MIKQLINIPRNQKFILACSGGVDSMAAVHFYKSGDKDFILGYFNHGTPQANTMEDFVISWATKNNVEFVIGNISRERDKGESKEEYWRNERYAWLNSFNLPIITCHHLDDCVETWIFSSLHGNPKIIASHNGNVIRPFLLNEKADLINWCVRNNVPWLEDKSNEDVNFPRNKIRHHIIPECLKINPGLKKVIKKKIIAAASEQAKKQDSV